MGHLTSAWLSTQFERRWGTDGAGEEERDADSETRLGDFFCLYFVQGRGQNFLRKLHQFQMSKENWTESGFESETSGLTYENTYQRSYQLSYPVIKIPPKSFGMEVAKW